MNNKQLLQEKINERIEQSYQKDIFGKAHEIIKNMRGNTLNYSIRDLEGYLNIPSDAFSHTEDNLRRDKYIPPETKEIKRLFHRDWGQNTFIDPETSLRIDANCINWEIMSGFDISPLYEIKWNGKIVYSASKLEKISLLLPVPTIPIFWKKIKPKVKIYHPGEWENRLDYLSDKSNFENTVLNHKKRLEELSKQTRNIAVKNGYLI